MSRPFRKEDFFTYEIVKDKLSLYLQMDKFAVCWAKQWAIWNIAAGHCFTVART